MVAWGAAARSVPTNATNILGDGGLQVELRRR